MKIKNFIFKLIRWYQKKVSFYLTPRCRFTPSCSEYAILSIQKYGLFAGIPKAVYRVLRCNPYNKGGEDFP